MQPSRRPELDLLHCDEAAFARWIIEHLPHFVGDNPILRMVGSLLGASAAQLREHYQNRPHDSNRGDVREWNRQQQRLFSQVLQTCRFLFNTNRDRPAPGDPDDPGNPDQPHGPGAPHRFKAKKSPRTPNPNLNPKPPIPDDRFLDSPGICVPLAPDLPPISSSHDQSFACEHDQKITRESDTPNESDTPRESDTSNESGIPRDPRIQFESYVPPHPPTPIHAFPKLPPRPEPDPSNAKSAFQQRKRSRAQSPSPSSPQKKTQSQAATQPPPKPSISWLEQQAKYRPDKVLLPHPDERVCLVHDFTYDPANPPNWREILHLDMNVDPAFPVVRDTGYAAEEIYNHYDYGYRWPQLKKRYPKLTQDDLRAILAANAERALGPFDTEAEAKAKNVPITPRKRFYELHQTNSDLDALVYSIIHNCKNNPTPENRARAYLALQNIKRDHPAFIPDPNFKPDPDRDLKPIFKKYLEHIPMLDPAPDPDPACNPHPPP